MKKNGRVNQVYYIDESLLEDLSVTSKIEYFASSLKFYRSVKDKHTDQLTEKQIKWLEKISEIMDKQSNQKIKKNTQKSYQSYKVKKFTLFPKKTKSGWVWFSYYE